MNNKKARLGILGTIAGFVLYAKYKTSISLSVSQKNAVYNGFRLMNHGRKILAITAHPDDLEIFVGGTIKLLSQRKQEIDIIDVTNGEKGVNLNNLAEIRKNEQLGSAEVLDVSNVRFLHLPDLHLQHIDNLKEILKREILDINPDIIFAFDYKFPWRAMVHPDHVSVGKAVHDIVKNNMKKEVLIVYYATRNANVITDISSVMKEKALAIQKHRSQLRFGARPYACLTRLFAKFNASKTAGKYVEVFRVEDESLI